MVGGSNELTNSLVIASTAGDMEVSREKSMVNRHLLQGYQYKRYHDILDKVSSFEYLWLLHCRKGIRMDSTTATMARLRYGRAI